MDIVALFCALDDFYRAFAPAWQKHLLPAPGRHRRRPCRLSTNEAPPQTDEVYFRFS
jgi:hypothetical protein